MTEALPFFKIYIFLFKNATVSTTILTDPSPSHSANIQQVLAPLRLSLLEHSGVIV